MPTQVLVVDDYLLSAETYAQLISSRTQLECLATDDPSTALEKIRSEPIKVVVLDQKMPKKSGTALYEEIKKIDPYIKAIMFSGEAQAEDVGEALSLGFVRYLHKNQIEQLPELVHLQYVNYLTDFHKNTNIRPILLHSEKKGIFLFGYTISFWLYQLKIVEERYIFQEKWKTIKQINAGETFEKEDIIEIEASFIHEASEEAKIASQISLSPLLFNQIKISLENAISTTFKESIANRQRNQIKITRKYELPKEPSDPTQLYVKSRLYEIAPIYRKIQCLIVQECSCCNARQPFPFIVYQPTNKLATRQVDYFNDKNMEEISTGDITP